MAYRVVHWGTGYTGHFGLEGVISSPLLELVGLMVERAGNAGKDAGEFCGMAPTGIRATNAFDEVLALKPACVSYFGRGGEKPDEGLGKVLRMLEAGINVVSTTFTNISHPKFVHEPVREQIAAACAKGNATFFTTGIEPGFGSDLLPMTLVSGANRIDYMWTAEIAKYGTYPVEQAIRYTMGLGLPYDQTPGIEQDDQILRLLGGTAQELAERIGVTDHDGVVQRIEYAPMPYDADFAFGHVEKGTRGALLASADVMYGETPIVSVMHVNYLFEEYPDHWPHSDAGTHTAYRAQVFGRPSGAIEISMGLENNEYHAIHATAMRAINAIPFVVETGPGQVGGLDVPMLHNHNIRPRR